METKTLLYYIMLLTVVTWQAPHEPDALPIQDITQSIFHLPPFFLNGLYQCYKHH